MNAAEIIARMRPIRGWFDPAEAELMIETAARAIELQGAIVEVGSYCGRSTVVLGSVVRDRRPGGVMHAIDPHEGQIEMGQGQGDIRSTLGEFASNIEGAGLTQVVRPIVANSYNVAWSEPIALLFVDAMHDYANVKRDFEHFEPFVEPGGYVAFHDYDRQTPGVCDVVHEALATGRYQKIDLRQSLIVLQRANLS